MAEPLLDGLRVLELAQEVAGPYGGKLLADLGAEVIKAEPPGGDSSRMRGPFRGGTPDPEHGGLFLYLNAGKRGIVVDVETAAGRQTVLDLCAQVDVVLESFPPVELERLGLGFAALHAANPRLVLVSATPFGQSGPRSAWRGNDLIAWHSSGIAQGFPALQVDHPDLAPLNAPSYAAAFLAGEMVAGAAMHGLLAVQRTGRGCHLDLSLQEAVAAENQSQFSAFERSGNARRSFSTAPSNPTVALLPCSDGWVAISPREEHQWTRWLAVMGNPEWGSEPRFADRQARERHWGELYPLLAAWSEVHSKAEIFESAQAARVACYPLSEATDLLASPQLKDRGFFVEVNDPELGPLTLPGIPYRLTDADTVEPRRAPRLGEHTDEVVAELVGSRGGEPHPPSPSPSTAMERGRSLAAGFEPQRAFPSVVSSPPRIGEGPRVVWPRAATKPEPASTTTAYCPLPTASSPTTADCRLPTASVTEPLHGVRIVDFSWVLTGPICTKYLAALGAEVIKVESRARPDLSQRDVGWEELNPSKRSITLNMQHEAARELARRLIAQSDVVIENFSTGVMERLGLGYPSLRESNPWIIMASSSALGRTGPERERVAYGTLIQCFTGWASLSAHPGLPPRSAAGIWTDPLTATMETFLLLAALWRQRLSGRGCFIDLSMAETTIAALPEPLLAWGLNRDVLQARGNRDPVYAPQGCYPAAGPGGPWTDVQGRASQTSPGGPRTDVQGRASQTSNDHWLALSVQSDAEWDALCRLMGRNDLLADQRLRTADGRRDQHDLLDAAIAAWTRLRSAEERAALLQSAGIAATPTLTVPDMLADAHLAARSFISEVEGLAGGRRRTLGFPWLVDGERPNQFRRPPRVGEDNEQVFRELLKLDEAEYARLVAEQVIY